MERERERFRIITLELQFIYETLRYRASSFRVTRAALILHYADLIRVQYIRVAMFAFHLIAQRFTSHFYIHVTSFHARQRF